MCLSCFQNFKHNILVTQSLIEDSISNTSLNFSMKFVELYLFPFFINIHFSKMKYEILCGQLYFPLIKGLFRIHSSEKFVEE